MTTLTDFRKTVETGVDPRLHGVLIDKYLNASVSPGSRHVVSL